MKQNETRPLVIIDNGHGCETAGKQSPFADGVLEWKYVRQVAHEVVDRLIALDFDARLLVPDDHDLPLQARCQRATNWCHEHSAHGGIAAQRLLVSIHVNAEPLLYEDDSGEASGWEAWVCGSNSNTRGLAAELYMAAVRHLPDTFPIRTERGNLRTLLTQEHSDASHRGGINRLGNVGRQASFYILRNTPCPAVLTENLFMTNRDDATYLLSTEGFESIVTLHVEGIRRYLYTRSPSPTLPKGEGGRLAEGREGERRVISDY